MARTCTSTPVKHLRRWSWNSSAQPMTSVFLTEFVNYLGKRQTDDLESRQDSTSIVLSPRVSETASLSRASAAGNLSDYLRIAEGHLSARASTGKSDVFATSARAAGNFGLIPKRETTEAVDERANVKRDKELVRLCKIADYADTMKIGQYLQTRPARKQLGNALHTLWRSWQTNKFLRWAFTLKNHSRNAELGRPKKYVFDTEGCSGIDVKVPSAKNPEMLVWVNACTDEVKIVDSLRHSERHSKQWDVIKAQGNLTS